ncbi:rod shape-determining protein MreC [uncultured Jatrophihabitans sp.]|uniref:rod shape-determining protein MreC n=1 Tax=uncultured Jatrophihabitans sp. TaxID=1610747 RepID=UPI0035CA4D3C
MRRLTRRQRLSAIVLVVVALCFITLDLGGGSLANAHSGVRGGLGSLYRGTDSVLGPVRRWVQGVPSAGTNEGRIDALRKRNAELHGEIARLRSDARTSGQLTSLQRSADATGARLLPARVTAYGPGSGFDWTVTLDAGANSGVRVGQTVTDGAGLVGRVLHADADSSVVLLAADPGSGVGVRDTRTGEIGVVTGQGADGFSFAPIKPTATVRAGDTLQTGPTGASTYVAGLPVGTVTSVRRSADGTVRAHVRPVASPTAVDVVGVVLSAPRSLAGRAALTPSGRPR